MHRLAPVLIALAVLAGCATPAQDSAGSPALQDLEETTTFDGEYVAMATTRIPGMGTPCGGVSLGAANGIVDEWELLAWAETVHLRLETNAVADPFAFRLCLIHADGTEELTRGPAPLELNATVAGNQTVQLVAMPDDESPAPHGAQTVTITATVRGRG